MNEWIEGPPEWTDDESRLVVIRYQRDGWAGPILFVARPCMRFEVASKPAEKAWELADGGQSYFHDAQGVQPCATYHMELSPPSVDPEQGDE